MIERTLKLGTPKAQPAGLRVLVQVLTFVKTTYRAIRNRLEINRLHELDDHQLLDIGLTRRDLRVAMTTSAFFEDPSSQLVRSQRRRVNASFADGL